MPRRLNICPDPAAAWRRKRPGRAAQVGGIGATDAGTAGRRLRQLHWKHWKTTAAKRRNLRVAGSGILHVALPNIHWDHLGVKTLSQTWQRLYTTA